MWNNMKFNFSQNCILLQEFAFVGNQLRIINVDVKCGGGISVRWCDDDSDG